MAVSFTVGNLTAQIPTRTDDSATIAKICDGAGLDDKVKNYLIKVQKLTNLAELAEAFGDGQALKDETKAFVEKAGIADLFLSSLMKGIQLLLRLNCLS